MKYVNLVYLVDKKYNTTIMYVTAEKYNSIQIIK